MRKRSRLSLLHVGIQLSQHHLLNLGLWLDIFCSDSSRFRLGRYQKTLTWWTTLKDTKPFILCQDCRCPPQKEGSNPSVKEFLRDSLVVARRVLSLVLFCCGCSRRWGDDSLSHRAARSWHGTRNKSCPRRGGKQDDLELSAEFFWSLGNGLTEEERQNKLLLKV